MAAEDLSLRALSISLGDIEGKPSVASASLLARTADAAVASSRQQENGSIGGDVKVTCFTEVVDDVNLHFQIIRLPKQIYAWIGCNSAKFGSLYAAAPTRPVSYLSTTLRKQWEELRTTNAVSVTSLVGGTSDNTSAGIARRLALKSGLSIILASNIPKNSPMLEANAERKLVEKLIELGYARKRSESSSS